MYKPPLFPKILVVKKNFKGIKKMWLTKDNVLIGLGMGLYVLGAVSLLAMNRDITAQSSEISPTAAQISPF